jgi:hypothetical protein
MNSLLVTSGRAVVVVFGHLPVEHRVVSTAVFGKRNRLAHSALDNLSCLVLPVLGIGIPAYDFCGLFLRTTPRKFDVCELVIWVKNLKNTISIYVLP